MEAHLPDCYNCRRFDFRASAGAKPVCEAYPKGIPADIYFRGADHTKPRDDDNGKQFEPLNEGNDG